ncbi:MAG: response regulator [Candidatus Omnitrophota bacterium]
MTPDANKEPIKDFPLDILLVEDSEADIIITKRAFKNAKLKNNLFIVGNGQECLDFVRHGGAYQDKQKYPRPDLIFLDVNMPKIDGFSVLEVLKEEERTRTIPIIMLTGSKNESDIMKSYMLGANSFIQKPVTYEEFVEIIDGFNFYWHRINRLPQKNQ